MNTNLVRDSEQAVKQSRCCTFLVADKCFAFNSDLVIEVLQKGVMNNVPLASPAIAGLLNLRGRIVPAIDLCRFLEFPPASSSIQKINIIVDIKNEWYCFLVDQLLDVTAYNSHQLTPPSNALPDVITGVLPTTNNLIHFLSPEKILKRLLETKTRTLSVG
jgi:chemotaxis signal transduction protein